LKELSLHLLDIAENSINAEASHIIISVEENSLDDILKMSVKDNGKGMTSEMAQRIMDPFITRKVGLGIPLLKAAAEMCNGFLHIESHPGSGTELIVQFQRSHIDRMPIGDLAGTILHLVVGSPVVHWTFIYKANDEIFEFDDQIIKQELNGIPLSEPIIISFIRNEISSGIKSLRLASDY